MVKEIKIVILIGVKLEGGGRIRLDTRSNLR